ncbi:MAG TPA: hypothetical protein VM283_04335, partial [Armatimonadota bacterium]|nr:hypothetical protein [Armatimonadota bacterium]
FRTRSGPLAGLPHLDLEPGRVSLYEEHRLPQPFASVESLLDGRRVLVALLTEPGPIGPLAHLDDQWWSLGARVQEDGLSLVCASGLLADNGRCHLLYGSQRQFMPYEDAWLDLPEGEATISKTVYLHCALPESAGYGFAETMWACWELWRPQAWQAMPATRLRELKARLLMSDFRDEPTHTGFIFLGHTDPRGEKGRPPYMQYGWTGKCLMTARALTEYGLALGDDVPVEMARKAADFFCANSAAPDGTCYVNYRYAEGVWEGQHPRQVGDALDSLADLCRVRAADGLDVPRVWTDFLARCCRALAARYTAPDYVARRTADVFAAAPMAKCGAMVGDEHLTAAARKLLGDFYERNARDLAEPYWGATLDAGCEDKEAGAGFLHSALAVHRATGDAELVDWAVRAAEWTVSWMYFWHTGFRPGTPCDGRIHTVGWTDISVQNMHLDVWGAFIAEDLLELAGLTGDARWRQIAVAMCKAVTQGTSSPSDFMWDLQQEGDQPEQFFQTNYWQGPLDAAAWRGGFHWWNPPWIATAGLIAASLLIKLDEDAPTPAPPGGTP